MNGSCASVISSYLPSGTTPMTSTRRWPFSIRRRLADRIASGPVLAGHRRVDDDDLGAAGLVAGVERAALRDVMPRWRIGRIHDRVRRVSAVAVGGGGSPSVSDLINRGPDHRRVVCERHGFDAGATAGARASACRTPARACVVAAAAHIHAGEHQMSGREAERHVPRLMRLWIETPTPTRTTVATAI